MGSKPVTERQVEQEKEARKGDRAHIPHVRRGAGVPLRQQPDDIQADGAGAAVAQDRQEACVSERRFAAMDKGALKHTDVIMNVTINAYGLQIFDYILPYVIQTMYSAISAYTPSSVFLHTS